MTRIAIIGAGISGLTLAHELKHHADVWLFEKSGGVGGRMSTRYAEPFEFDHGAQFFTARSAAFRTFLMPLIDAGIVATWHTRFVELNRNQQSASRDWDDQHPHYVGTPRMNSVGAFLARDLRIHKKTAIANCAKTAGRWKLEDAGGGQYVNFDWIVFTAPPAQTAALSQRLVSLNQTVSSRHMSACFAVMLGFETPLDLPWGAARVRNADISWVSANSTKPGRPKAYTLLIHSTNAWADKHVESDATGILEHLLDETSDVVSRDVRQASFVRLHRWRYANIAKQDEPMSFIDTEHQVAACGDWFVRGRVEAAFRSALHLAASMREHL